MKHYFEGKVFSEEVELWGYLQGLKDLDLGIRDGFYFGEFVEDVQGKLRFRCVLKFGLRKNLIDTLYYRPLDNPRFYIYIREGKPFCVGIDSVYLTAHDEIEDHGKWEIAHYRDLVLESQVEKPRFTAEECERAMDALVKLLIVNSKKVA